MKIINGKKYYTAKEVGGLVNRTHLTVHLWDTWSNELAERGDKRLIPEPIRIGKQRTRYWSEGDVPRIEEFAKNIQRGDLAEFSQRQWGKKVDKPLKKTQRVSEKRTLNNISHHAELSLQEKLVYALAFFLSQREEDSFVESSMLKKYVRMQEHDIETSLEKLMNSNLLGKVDNRYMVLL